MYLPDKKYGEHKVGEESGEVDDFARALDAFHDDGVYDEPRTDQAEQHPPLDASKVVDRIRTANTTSCIFKEHKRIILVRAQYKYLSRTFLYQKYWVSDDISHSGTVALDPSSVGQELHGRVA